MKTKTLGNLWVAVTVVGLEMVGCGGGGGSGNGKVQVKGKVTDSQGTQGQAGGVRSQALGGSGSVAATTKVRASTVGAGGALTTVAEVNVAAQGSYTLEVPEGQDRLVLQAVNASGQVLVSSLLDTSGTASTTTAPPMDSESTLEAQVFTQIVADGTSASDVDTVDLRARINTQMAAAASQGASTDDALRSRVKALGEAVRAAQQSKVEMYGRAGVKTSQGELFQAELSASASLNAALDAGSSSAEAYEAFAASIQAAAQQKGASAEQQAQGEQAAGASFRTTLKARLSTQDAQPLLDASSRAAASLEARSSGVALQALVSGAGAVDAATQKAADASTSLRAQVSASATAAAAAQAFASFQANVATNADVKGTVLGNYLQVSVANQLAVSVVIQASVAAAATLDTALDAAAKAAVTTGGTDVTLLAKSTADAYQAYATAVRAQASALTAFGTKAAPSVELLVVAEGSFQTGG